MTLRPRMLAGLVLAGLIAAFLCFGVELVREDGPPHPSAAALHNRYLAAGKLLERRGYRVYAQPAFTRVPARAGALLLGQPLNSLNTTELQALQQWISQGNTVLASVQALETRGGLVTNTLVAPLGLRLNRASDHPGASSTAHADTQNPPWLRVSAAEGYLQAAFLPALHLVDPRQRASLRIADADGAHVLVYTLGQGRLVLCSDLRLFENDRIGAHDHAALLLRLLEQSPDAGPVWVIYEGDYPSLFTLAWRHARPLIVALAVLALAWLWRVSRRFGPLLPAVAAPRRRLSEHLLASGRYLWFAGQQARLYQGVRQALRQRLFQRHPSLRQLSHDELAAELARQAGLDPALVRRALLATPAADLNQFLHDMRVLQTLRKLT